MNPFRRWWLKYLLRTAARGHRVGELTDAYYGALVVRLVMRLDGRKLVSGDDVGLVLFHEAAKRAIGAKLTVLIQHPGLTERYGPYAAAPMFVRNATDPNSSEIRWNDQAEVLYGIAYRAVHPADRFEKWARSARAQFPTILRLLLWVVTTAVAFIPGRLTH